MNATLTNMLLKANIGAFFLVNLLALMLFGPQFIDWFFHIFGLVPDGFYFWQPLSSLFLHGGFLHLAVNMLALWSIGTPIERELGMRRFFLLYFISGLGGAFLVYLFAPQGSVTIGASGAIMGLLGALAVYFPNSLLLVFFFPMKARNAAIIFGLITVLLAVVDSSSGISHLGHLGGLLAGMAYSIIVRKQAQPGLGQPHYIQEEDAWTYDQPRHSAHQQYRHYHDWEIEQALRQREQLRRMLEALMRQRRP